MFSAVVASNHKIHHHWRRPIVRVRFRGMLIATSSTINTIDLGVATKCGVRTIVGVSTAIPEVVLRIKSVASLANGNCDARREIDPKTLVMRVYIIVLAHLGIVPSSRRGPGVRTRDAFEVDDWWWGSCR